MEDLPRGFRFFPTEEELVSFYLHNKLRGARPEIDRVIPVVDIYRYNPWDLPSLAGEVCRRDPEQWFFFSPMQETEARGGKPNRQTTEGYWKATGCQGFVFSSDNRIIGSKKTMVFYKGRAGKGTKTQWKMNEYKVVEETYFSSLGEKPKVRQELSLCRVYYRTKSLRAFDRRPNGVVISPQTTVQPTGSSMSGHGSLASAGKASWPSPEEEKNVSSQVVGTGKWNLAEVSKLLLGE